MAQLFSERLLAAIKAPFESLISPTSGFSLLFLGLLGPAATSLSILGYLAVQRTWLYLANLAFYPADELPGVFAANAAPHEVNGSLWSLPPYLLLPLLFRSSPAFRWR